MIRFTIQNFQSIEYSTFDFDKFVTFVGPSNRGKTAVVRALRTLLYNIWDISFLRKDTKVCTLILELSEPSPVRKIVLTKPENKYVLTLADGIIKTFPKCGKDTPQELKDLCFAIIESERGDKFNLNFQTQLDPLFLIGQSEVLVTSFFNSVFKIVKYEGALRHINSDITKTNRKHIDNNRNLTDKQLELDGVTKELIELEEKALALNTLLDELQRHESDVKEVEQGLEWVSQTRAQEEEINLLQTFQNRASTLLEKISTTKSFTIKVTELEELIGIYEELYFEEDHHKKEAIFLTEVSTPILEEIKKLNNLSEITSLLNKHQICENLIQQLQQQVSNQEIIEQSNKESKSFFDEIINVKWAIQQLNSDLENVDIQEDLQEKINEDILKLSQYKEFIFETVKICPLCEKPL